MIHKDGIFNGKGTTDIFHQSWLPETGPRGILIIVHGLAEHSGRYKNLVDFFVPRGYGLYGFDLPGHGKSAGRRVHIGRFGDYLEAVNQYYKMVSDRHPGIPTFLVGHSMGGLIGAAYLLEYQEGLAGAVLSAPSVKAPGNISTATVVIGKILSALAPTAGLLQLDARGVSRDSKVVEAYIGDPLVYRGKTTARLAAELLASMQQVTAGASRITLPLLLLQGSADRLVDPAGTQLLYDKAGSADKKLILYKGLYHEVFNEPEHDDVFRDMEVWLESHLR